MGRLLHPLIDFVMLIFERAPAAVALVVLCVCSLPLADRVFRRAARALRRLALHPILSAATVAVVFVMISAVLAVARWPQPHVQDEFSHLLAADTFAHGRLVNPRHPMWMHLEMFHALSTPNGFATKYPPGPGMIMAAGQALAGDPLYGLWLAGALAAIAVWWLLRAVMPPRWALLGALLVVTHSQFLYLGRLYFGGAVGLAGGALLLGGLVRVMQRPRSGPALAIGVALAVLANSRPSEGLMLCCLLSIPLLVWLVRTSAEVRRLFFMRVVPPVAVILVLATAGAMAFYNYRITGSPLTLPYLAHAREYSVAPNYVWESLRPEPKYQHAIIRELHAVWEVEQYQRQVGLRPFLHFTREKLQWLLVQTFWPTTWALALLAAVLAMRRYAAARWSLVLFVAFVLIVTGFQVFINVHYLAPGAPLLVLAVVAGLRWLRPWQRDRRQLGRLLVRSLIAMHIVALAAWFVYVRRSVGWETDRAQIVRELSHDGRRHLVLVRYGPTHDVHAEWVANGADIDAGSIVWAREMGPKDDQELLDYYKDRTVWMLDADDLPHRLVPYSASSIPTKLISGRSIPAASTSQPVATQP